MLPTNEFLKRAKDGKLLVSAERISIVIPKEYFDSGIAELIGTKLSTLGIFSIEVKFESSSKLQEYVLNIPMVLNIPYSEKDERKSSDEQGGKEFLFHLDKDDTFLESEMIVANASAVKRFADLLHAGKLPVKSYEDIFHQYLAVQEQSGTDLGISATMTGAIIAELARAKNDISVPYRVALAEGKAKEGDFTLVRLRLLPEINNSFSGVSFENINRALSSAVVKSRKGVVEEPSIIEEVVRGHL